MVFFWVLFLFICCDFSIKQYFYTHTIFFDTFMMTLLNSFFEIIQMTSLGLGTMHVSKLMQKFKRQSVKNISNHVIMRCRYFVKYLSSSLLPDACSHRFAYHSPGWTLARNTAYSSSYHWQGAGVGAGQVVRGQLQAAPNLSHLGD